MKYFVIDGRIGKDMLVDFVNFYNSNAGEDCTITLNTGGGDSYVMWALIHMINEMPKVRLLIQSVYSAGFEIAYATECEKLLSPTARGMCHQATSSVTLNQDTNVCYNEDKCIVRNLSIDRKIGNKVAKEVMTKSEYKRYKKDRDIYFDFKRMKQIFKGAKII